MIGHTNLPEPAVLDLLSRIYLFLCFYEIDYANQSEPVVLDLFIYLFIFRICYYAFYFTQFLF